MERWWHPCYCLLMSNYAIMRMSKLKSRVSLVGALRHNNRDVVPNNADIALADYNNSRFSTAESLQMYTNLLPKRVRKNAVHAVEVVMTASPEWFEKASIDDRREFFSESEIWARKFFGGKNVLSVAVHRDEKTPHMHVIAMPIVDGKLNAKAIIGGSRDRMRELQDDFYEKVGKPLGMDRGITREASKRHTQPKEFARIMSEQKTALDERERGINEREEEFKKVMGTNPQTVLRAFNEVHRWIRYSPDELREIADRLDKKNVKSWAEYTEKLSTEQKNEVDKPVQNVKKTGKSSRK